MDKAIMLSLTPKMCLEIATRNRKVFISKIKTKLTPPFKVYIYCQRGDKQFLQSKDNMFYYLESKDFIGGHGYGLYQRLNGLVIGEFICDKLIESREEYGDELYHSYQLTYDDTQNYGKGLQLYGWNISFLKLYETPKKIEEFLVEDNVAVQSCKHRFVVGQSSSKTADTGWIKGGYVCSRYDEDVWCTKCKTKPLSKPPKNWQYVTYPIAEARGFTVQFDKILIFKECKL